MCICRRWTSTWGVCCITASWRSSKAGESLERPLKVNNISWLHILRRFFAEISTIKTFSFPNTTRSRRSYTFMISTTIAFHLIRYLKQICNVKAKRLKSFAQMYLGPEARVHTCTCSSQLSGEWIWGQLSQLWQIYLDTISPEQRAWPIEGNWLSCDSHEWKYAARHWDGRKKTWLRGRSCC